MADFAPRIPQVPSGVTGPIGDYLRLVVKQLNAEGRISIFSAANPNTSGLSGLPGDIAVNIGSASTSTRAWVLAGAARSLDTNNWKPLRIA